MQVEAMPGAQRPDSRAKAGQFLIAGVITHARAIYRIQ